jgi:dCMP deaminase
MGNMQPYLFGRNMNNELLDLSLLEEAYKEAIKYSTDPSTQNGAVIVRFSGDSYEIVARGANHFPRGVNEEAERWQRPAKYQYVEHAERNAVYDAAKNGVATDKLVMYCPWFACADCARAIIQAGISEVVGHDCELHKTSASWQQSIAVAYKMLEEAGVKFRHVKGKFGLKIRFNEKVVEV